MTADATDNEVFGSIRGAVSRGATQFTLEACCQRANCHRVVLAAFVLIGVACTYPVTLPLAPLTGQPQLDVQNWIVIDTDPYRSAELRVHDLVTSSVEQIHIDGLLNGDVILDFSISQNGRVAALLGLYAFSRGTESEQLSIVQLPDGAVVSTAPGKGLFVAWSNAGDRLALVDRPRNLDLDGLNPVTLSVLDADLNPLLARLLVFDVGSVSIDAAQCDISWSPDDSLIAISVAVQFTDSPSGGFVRTMGTGLVVSSSDPLAEAVRIPFSTAYFVAADELVGTSYWPPRDLLGSYGTVYKFSLINSEVRNSTIVPGPLAVASAWAPTATYLTREPLTITPEIALAFLTTGGLLATSPELYLLNEMRIRDLQGVQSRLLGALGGTGPYFGYGPTKLVPRAVMDGVRQAAIRP